MVVTTWGCLCGHNLTVDGPSSIMSNQHPLEVCKKKNISILLMERGLGWLVGFMQEFKECFLNVTRHGHVNSASRVVPL
jgi:hypothetical protein